MTETIKQYFRRFDNSLTESLYSAITLEDYYKNKAANDYLDYDKESLFRKNKMYCGIRNIDNSCYLSVTLQILYNLQWLRERIFKIAQTQASVFLKEIQKLFGLMYKGSLIYVDPSDLFEVLMKLHPQVFVNGNQNDFHQVFTLVLDELEKSFTNEDDRRFFKKLFYGKMKVQLTDQKGNISNSSSNDGGNSFNLINLSSASKNFQAALKDYKKQVIEGYINNEGEKIKASREINFLETPAILSFFINRVSFVNNKLVKNSSQFEFDQKILFAKSSTNKSMINKVNDAQIEKQINLLNEWIASIASKKEHLTNTIAYLQQKQFTDINSPAVENPLSEQIKQSTKKYLKMELQQIDKKTQQTKLEINELQKKRMRQAEENYTQVYNLWAVMIHYGSNAQSGHYKICIKVNTQNNTWVEFNDRRAQEISNQKILQYKKKGEVCCLFYRRNALQSEPEKGQITSNLKKYVKEQQQEIFKKIDNARILQALYQQFESINLIWEYQNLVIRQQQRISTYFFKPLLHLIIKNTPPQICKGFLLYQSIKEQKFIENVKAKLIDSSRSVAIPQFDFGIPKEYWNISQAVKQFLFLELNNPIGAYELISFYFDISITDKIVLEQFKMLKQVIFLKGIFYEAMLVEHNLLSLYDEFAKIIDRMLSTLQTDDLYGIVLIPIREHIRNMYLNKIIQNKNQIQVVLKKHPSISPAVIRQIGPNLFFKRFQLWIYQRKRIQNLDESVLQEYQKHYEFYITKQE